MIKFTQNPALDKHDLIEHDIDIDFITHDIDLISRADRDVMRNVCCCQPALVTLMAKVNLGRPHLGR